MVMNVKMRMILFVGVKMGKVQFRFMRMIMLMHVLTLFFMVDQDREMRTLNSALFNSFLFDLNTRDPEAIHLCDEGIRIRQELQQGRAQHITGSAHPTIDI